MTKEPRAAKAPRSDARTAKPLRATAAEWDEINRARGGKSLQAFVLEAALGVARGELRAPAQRKPADEPTGVRAVSPLTPRFNRVTSLGGPPRPVQRHPSPAKKGA